MINKLKTKWRDMLKRCYNPKSSNYKNYGARGIRVCDEWHDFNNFYDWCIANGYDETKSRKDQSLDRINNNGNYEPSNCRFTNMSVQNANMRHNTKTGYVGVLLHNSGTVYYSCVKMNKKRYYIGMCKSKNECAKMRNDFIIKNNLPNPLNEIKEELENVLPTKINIYYAYDITDYHLIYKTSSLKELCKMTKLTGVFINDCILKRRNSRKYIFKKEVVYK